jgi:hypothetical protein
LDAEHVGVPRCGPELAEPHGVLQSIVTSTIGFTMALPVGEWYDAIVESIEGKVMVPIVPD